VLASEGVETLDPGECLRLLRQVSIGRVALTDQALPTIEPARFALVDDCVVIRAGLGSALAVAAQGTVVGFSADEVAADPEHGGWTVSAVGVVEVVTDDQEISRLSKLPLRGWLPGEECVFVRIRLEVLKGLRVAPRKAPGDAPRGGPQDNGGPRDKAEDDPEASPEPATV
jgi:hypothetical protein